MDEVYAEESRFKSELLMHYRAQVFSALFGTKLPGEGCVYVSQNLNFLRPVYIGDTVIATIVITEIDREKRRVFFDTFCKVKNKKVIRSSRNIHTLIKIKYIFVIS